MEVLLWKRVSSKIRKNREVSRREKEAWDIEYTTFRTLTRPSLLVTEGGVCESIDSVCLSDSNLICLLKEDCSCEWWGVFVYLFVMFKNTFTSTQQNQVRKEWLVWSKQEKWCSERDLFQCWMTQAPFRNIRRHFQKLNQIRYKIETLTVMKLRDTNK